MELPFINRPSHHGGKFSSHASTRGFLQRSDGLLRTNNIGMPRIPREGIANHLKTDPLGSMKQCLFD